VTQNASHSFVSPDKSSLLINVYDGPASLWPTVRRSLSHHRRESKQLFVQDENFSSLSLKVPFYDNFGDNYNVIVFRTLQAGRLYACEARAFHSTSLDLMLIPKDGILISRWRPGISLKRNCVLVLVLGVSDADGKSRYETSWSKGRWL